MELCQTEPLGIEDDHHGGIRYVHTHFYHGGGNENLGLSLGEMLHFLLLFSRLHLSMYLAESELREGFLQRLESLFEILQVTLLALLDEGEDDIHLSAKVDLATDALVEARQLVIKLMERLNRLSARWQFVDDAHVEVAIDGHCQGARNRSGGHHKHMRWILALSP